MIPEYKPWSKRVLQECRNLQRNGKLPALDLGFTAKCSQCSCIYCDSKPEVSDIINSDETSIDNMLRVLDECVTLGLKWVYVCGLGEPLEDVKCWKILDFLSEKNVRISMFSNGQFIQSKEVAGELKKRDVNIILKMDTFDEAQFDKILNKPGAANKIYAARDYLLSAGYAQSSAETDLAFSLIPTAWSLPSMPDIIEYCKKYKIFASIGELEFAGEVLRNNVNDILKISKTEVDNLKRLADEYYQGNYMRPVCPSIMTGLHIDNKGNVIVDRITGLNCKWFLLKEPDTHKIGDIYNSSIKELFASVIEYRNNAFIKNKEIIDTYLNISYVFGGCGGNPPEIIKLVREDMGG